MPRPIAIATAVAAVLVSAASAAPYNNYPQGNSVNSYNQGYDRSSYGNGQQYGNQRYENKQDDNSRSQGYDDFSAWIKDKWNQYRGGDRNDDYNKHQQNPGQGQYYNNYAPQNYQQQQQHKSGGQRTYYARPAAAYTPEPYNEHKQYSNDHDQYRNKESEYGSPDVDVYQAILCGEKEVPEVIKNEPGFGYANLEVNRKDYTAKLIVTHFMTAPVTKLHIHGPADTKSNSSVLFDTLSKDPAFVSEENPLRNVAPIKLTEEQYGFLAQGLLYINVHTKRFPGGALRGNLLCSSKECYRPKGVREVARFFDDEICNNSIFNGGQAPHY